MSASAPLVRTARIVGALLLLAGVAVFAIRLQHAGPYAMPEKGNLRAGIAALVVGLALVAPWLRASSRVVTVALLLASPVVLFFALYSTLAELEEVVVLRATDSDGRAANLRLWIVDAEGAAWVSMPREKAEEHGLDGARVELLRGGGTSCVVPSLARDPADGERTFRLRDEKYAIQRLGRLIGLFGDGPSPTTVTLRLDPCP
jgi:hypothetical protein